MIVTCPRCLTKFNLPDENLDLNTEINLRCSRCEEEFVFTSQGDVGALTDETDLLLGVKGKVEADAVDGGLDEFTENDLFSEPPATPDTVSDQELDDGFEAVGAGLDIESESGPESEPEAEFGLNVDELFSSTDDAAAENLGEHEGTSGGTASDNAIFELADDFGSDDGDFNSFVESAPEDEAAASVPQGPDNPESEIEELALDIGDIDLGEIEFDSLDDEEVDSGGSLGNRQSPKETQNDGDDDFSGLLDFKDEGEELAPEPSEAGPEVFTPVEVELSGKKKSVFKSGPGATPAGSQKRTLMLTLSCFLVFSLALWAGYGLWQRFSVDMVKHLQLLEISNQRLRLPSDRVVVVLRGKVVNTSPKLVTDLKIKGVLVDSAGQIVAEVVTAGGVSFSEEELDLLDSDKLTMLENASVNLPPNGGELPFMIAFYDYPDKASECYVELTSFKVKNGRVR